MANILEEVQQFVADKLNADPQLSACPFLVENKKDIDFEIKNALGKQGIVGLVMTPKATFAGAFQDVGLAWQLDELEISIVESVTTNRGKKTGYVTGQDASMRLFDVLCPLSGEGEGQFSPVSYEEGEDGNLLVNKCILKCLVHAAGSQPTPDPSLTLVTYAGGYTAQYPLSGTLNSGDLPNRSAIQYVRIGSSIDEIGDRAFRGMEFLMGVEIPDTVATIGTDAFAGAEGMTDIEIPSSVSSIGSDAFFGCNLLSSVMFQGKTLEQVQAMDNYPWGLEDESIIHAELSPPVDPTELTWALSSGTVLMSADVVGNYEFLADPFKAEYGSNVTARKITDLSVGSRVTDIGQFFNSTAWRLSSVTLREGLSSIGEGAFDTCSALISVAVPSSVTQIGEDAFKVGLTPTGKDALSSLQLVLMRGKTAEEVSSMANWPWGIPNPEIISAELG